MDTEIIREQLDHPDRDLPSDWSADRIAELVTRGDPSTDAQAVRVLAARIANQVERHEDPLMVLEDLNAALKSIAVVVQIIGQDSAGDDDERLLESDSAAGKIVDASRAVAEVIGYF